MPRVKRGTTTRAKHKSLFAKTKGMRGGRKNLVKLAKQAFLKAGTNAFIDRRRKKRDFRASWIITINAACREHNISYSEFMSKVKAAGVEIDRKILADMAKNHPAEFQSIFKEVTK